MISQQATAIDVLDDRLYILRQDRQWMSERIERRAER